MCVGFHQMAIWQADRLNLVVRNIVILLDKGVHLKQRLKLWFGFKLKLKKSFLLLLFLLFTNFYPGLSLQY